MRSQQKSRASTALVLILLLLGDRVVLAHRISDDIAAQNRSSGSLRQTSRIPCRNPARWNRKCAEWSAFCPASGKSQPPALNHFMTEWCPGTCGMPCDPDEDSGDEDEEYRAGTMQSDEENEPLHEAAILNSGVCLSTMVSRRRNKGNMCACRRRSKPKGLPPGWTCNQEKDWIEFVGTEALGQEPICCCKEGTCSPESVRRGDAVQHDHGKGEERPLCCKQKYTSLFGDFCPYATGYKEKMPESFCTPPKVKPSIQNCADRLTRWLEDEDWYKVLRNWEQSKDIYEGYMPCMVPEDIHVYVVMLDPHNALGRVTLRNPMRRFIALRPECRSLSYAEIAQALTRSYKDLCPFGMPHRSYVPDLKQEGTCSYDPKDKSIKLLKHRRCSEGHRCACPIFNKNQAFKQSAYDGYAGYTVCSYVAKGGTYIAAGSITLGAASGEGGAGAALLGTVGGWFGMEAGALGTALTGFGTGATAFLATWGWPIILGTLIIGLLAFGISYVWKAARHSCSNTVGCYPLDCIEVKNVGCRLRPSPDFQDERNEFWMLPPPTYKCAYKKRKCKLNVCTKSNMWTQRVGIFKTRSWRKSGYTQVYNCQPMLSEDMSSSQRALLRERTRDLRIEYDTLKHRVQILRQRLYKACPWTRPMKADVIRCQDGVSCDATLEDQSCCTHRSGIMQCPENFPIMCNDGKCDDPEGLCQDYGGKKDCPLVNDDCPWELPTVNKGMAECQDGNFSKQSFFRIPCTENGGVRRCPFDKPIMCADKSCNGDHCCKTSCDKHGGPLPCKNALLDKAGNLPSVDMFSPRGNPKNGWDDWVLQGNSDGSARDEPAEDDAEEPVAATLDYVESEEEKETAASARAPGRRKGKRADPGEETGADGDVSTDAENEEDEEDEEDEEEDEEY